MISRLKKIIINPESLLDISGKTIGYIAENGKSAIGKADIYMYNKKNIKALAERIPKYIGVNNVILTFFYWDYDLNKYKNINKYIDFLNEVKTYGYNKLCQIDFSVWYEDPVNVKLEHMLLNFQYMQLAIEMGFMTALNFNNILFEYKNIYKKILPEKIPTVFIDDNHNDANYFIYEKYAFDMLTDNFDISDIVIRTDKHNYRKCFIIDRCKEKNINYQYVGTERTIMGIKSKKRKPIEWI